MSSQATNADLEFEGFTDSWVQSLQLKALVRSQVPAKSRLVDLLLEEGRIEVLSRPLEAPIGDGRSPNDAQRSRRVEFYLSLISRGSSAGE